MAAFSRKHYQIIAAAIVTVRNGVSLDGPTAVRNVLDDLTDELSHRFAQDNPRFDAERFARAAGAEVL